MGGWGRVTGRGDGGHSRCGRETSSLWDARVHRRVGCRVRPEGHHAGSSITVMSGDPELQIAELGRALMID